MRGLQRAGLVATVAGLVSGCNPVIRTSQVDASLQSDDGGSTEQARPGSQTDVRADTRLTPTDFAAVFSSDSAVSSDSRAFFRDAATADSRPGTDLRPPADVRIVEGPGIVEYVSFSSAGTVVAGQFDIARPAGVLPDDVLILYLGGGGGEPDRNQTGWTRFAWCFETGNQVLQCLDAGGDLNGQAFYRVVSRNEPDGYTLFNARSNHAEAIIVAVRNADPSNPIFSYARQSSDGDGNATIFPSTDGTRGGVLVCAMTHDDPQQLRAPAGMTLVGYRAGHGDAINVLVKELTSDGPTGAIKAFNDNVVSGGNNDLAFSMVVRPRAP